MATSFGTTRRRKEPWSASATLLLGACIALALSLGCFSQQAWATDGKWSGSGTETDPYLIEDAADLNALSEKVYDEGTGTHDTFEGKYFALANDINLGGEEFTPIGYYSTTASASYPFGGVFDGRGHTVSGLSITKYTKSNGTGLFGGVEGTADNPAVLKNFTVAGSITTNQQNVAGVCGQAGKFVAIENVCNKVDITNTKTSSGTYTGGILGSTSNKGAWWVRVENCCNEGTINATGSSSSAVGGVIGRIHTGNVSGSPFIVSNCYNTGSVSGGKWVGGVVGQLYNTNQTGYLLEVSNCFNAGAVTATSESGTAFGSFAYGGAASSLVISNCYTNAAPAVADKCFGYDCSTWYTWDDKDKAVMSDSDMKASSFVDTLGNAFASGSDYPVLVWQAANGISVTEQPQSATYAKGAPITALSVTAAASDEAALSYQWHKVVGENDSAINGATAATYQPADTEIGAYDYYCAITSASGASAKSNTATITIWSGTAAATPTITAQPQNATFGQNAANATLTVAASASDGGTLTYQWFTGTDDEPVAVAGATGETLSVPTDEMGEFTYWCVVTNTAEVPENTASVTSDKATVTIDAMKIGTAEELLAFANSVKDGNAFAGSTIELSADIDLSGITMIPIGNKTKPFSGVFDGKGHTILGLNLNDGYNQALFGCVKGTASNDLAAVQNLIVKGSVTATGSNAAGIAAEAQNALFRNVGNECAVSSAYNFAGGIIGYVSVPSGGTYSSNVFIVNCYNKGSISATSNFAGGIAGGASGYGLTISDSYSIATVKAGSYAGGILGSPNSATGSYPAVMNIIKNCYAAGSVESDGYAGGIAGSGALDSYNFYTTNSYYEETCAAIALGMYASSDPAEAVSAEDLTGMASTLNGEAFMTDCYFLNNGLPELTWEKSSAPKIIEQPASAAYLAGSQNAAALTVSAETDAAGELTYQWYRCTASDGSEATSIEGATSATYAGIDTATAGKTYYYCVVSSGETSTRTLIATINIYAAAQKPVIKTVSDNVSIMQGSSSQPISVEASSKDEGELTYQWYESDSAANNETGTAVEGATANEFSDFSAELGDHYYYCVVTNTVVSQENTATATTRCIKVSVQPCTVSSSADMIALSNAVNNGSTFEGVEINLTADVALSSSFTPIGSSNATFLGTFNGNGHTVTLVNMTGAGYLGLFGHAGSASTTATIKNLVVKGTVTSSSSYNAGVVGWGENVKLQNVGNEANVSSTGYYATAGLVGGSPTACLITIDSCYNKGSITSSGYDAAGLVGFTRNNTSPMVSIINSYNAGNVTASSYAGGIYTLNQYYGTNIPITIDRCYNSGTVKATGAYGYAGAIIGIPSNRTLTDSCFFLDSSCSAAVGEGSVTGTITSVSSDELHAVPEGLNAENEKKFLRGEGYPILYWEGDEYIEPGTTTLPDDAIAAIDDVAFTGSAIMPEPVVTVEGNVLVKDTDYTVAYKGADGEEVEPTAVGTYTVEVTGMGDYEGTVSATFAITEAPVSGTWLQGSKGKWYCYDDATAAMLGKGWPADEWANIDSAWYRFDADGWMQTGWVRVAEDLNGDATPGNDGKGAWYKLGSDGKLVTGAWEKDSQGWCYVDDETGEMWFDRWTRDTSGPCYIGPKGYCLTGWFKVDTDVNGASTPGAWYFADGSGCVKCGSWYKDSKGWCYTDPETGMMWADRWAKDSVGPCYIGSEGYCMTEWFRASTDCEGNETPGTDGKGAWYYANASGQLQRGNWYKDSQGWCYTDPTTGEMWANKWIKDSVAWCFIGEAGYCVTGDVQVETSDGQQDNPGEGYFRFDNSGRLMGEIK